MSESSILIERISPLESESSSASLTTYLIEIRNVIAAEDEAEIYNRIRNIENMHYYNVPPQNNAVDYERLDPNLFKS